MSVAELVSWSRYFGMINNMNPKKVIRKVVPKSAVKQLESTYRKGRGVTWQARHGYPARSLKVIAITGTNGKTTTASYVNSVLNAGGLKTAVYTTAYYEIAGKRVPNRTHMTVTSQKSVQSFFAKAKKAQVDWVILEVTSHALVQDRIAGTNVEVAVMTNLTQDHLDYHGTMEVYADAKALLFGQKYGTKTAILNSDDDWYDHFANVVHGKTVSYGEHSGSSIKLKKAKMTSSGTDFSIKYDGRTIALNTKLLGKFNVYNALAAAGVGFVIGLSDEVIAEGIGNLSAVPGRMEEIKEGQSFNVLVDFAYTPDALLNALTTLRPMTDGKLRIVFGATGDRDASKRSLMGEVVAENADAIYLTDDETYTEDPEKIRDAVYEGIRSKGAEAKTKVIEDRLDAIKQAFADAEKGDTVLLTGIGHEDYRNMGGKKLPWDEREIARKLLQSDIV